MHYFQGLISVTGIGGRLALLLATIVVIHLLVRLIKHLTAKMAIGAKRRKMRKAHSVMTLTTSALIFAIYFLGIGFVLEEFGVSLTAYLASASIIGLAVGFGSQGIVQDVVTGITFIFSDLIDVGDLVEVSGQTGIVKSITARFVELENPLGAIVFIPNRSVTNVISYPRGYVRCLVDVTLFGDTVQKDKIVELVNNQMLAAHQQYPGILVTPPSEEGRFHLQSGKEIYRIKFRIWPNRGQPIENNFSKELMSNLKAVDAKYEDWMISVSYETEQQPPIID